MRRIKSELTFESVFQTRLRKTILQETMFFTHHFKALSSYTYYRISVHLSAIQLKLSFTSIITENHILLRLRWCRSYQRYMHYIYIHIYIHIYIICCGWCGNINCGSKQIQLTDGFDDLFPNRNDGLRM